MWKRTLRIVAALVVILPMAPAGPASAHQWIDYFVAGDTNLSPQGYRVAREVAAYAAQAPSRIVITAHEDGLEAATRADDRLDVWRAREMMLELMRLGVSPGAIEIEAKKEIPSRLDIVPALSTSR